MNLQKRKFVWACSTIAVIAAAGVSSVASAQDAGNDEAEEDRGGVPTIVVTARKSQENLQDVPIAVTALDSSLIENRAIQDISELDRVAPNIYFTTTAQSSFANNVTIRGIGSTETLLVSQPAIGIYVDDIYQATTLTAGATEAFDIDRIEVLKGPQGTLYGRNTTGGAILIHTNQPEMGVTSADFQFRYGNYDAIQARAAINLPLGDSVALRVAGSYADRDGFAEDRTNDRDIANRESYSLRGSLRAELTDRLEVTLRGDVSKSKSNGFAQRLVALAYPGNPETPNAPGGSGATLSSAALFYGTGLGTNPNAFAEAAALALAGSQRRSFEYNPDARLFEETNVHGFSGTITYDIGDNVELKSITAWRGFDFSYSNECCDAGPWSTITQALPDFPVDPSLYVQGPNAELDQFSQELQITGSVLDDRLDFAAGVYYFNSDGRDLSQPLIFPDITAGTLSNTDNDVFNESIAGYAQGSFEIVDNLRLTAGIRYTDEEVSLRSRNNVVINAQTPGALVICQVPADARINGQCLGEFQNEFTDWSYALGLDYRLSDELMIYARTGNGYKAGGINARGSNTNLNFAPEDVTDYEIGFKSDLLDNRLRINGAVFIQQFKGFQQIDVVFNPATNAISTALVNQDINGNRNRVDMSGFELEVIAQPTEGLTLQAAYGHISPDFKSGLLAPNLDEVITGTPENSFNASFNYELPVSDNATLSFYGGWSWLDDVDFSANGGLILPDGSKFANDATIQEAYSLFDGRITLALDNQDMSISLYGRNLTNKYYIVGAGDFASSLGPIVNIEGQPRQWGIELNKSF